MDHKIYVYSRETYRLKGTCDRHNSFVKNFDFSEDSVYIQSDSGDYEHLYFEAEDGEYFASGSQLKNIRWSDWTCTYGWPVQGAYPARAGPALGWLGLLVTNPLISTILPPPTPLQAPGLTSTKWTRA